MPSAPKSKTVQVKFVIDCSAPVTDGIFDTAAFEKFLRDRVKVDGRTNNLTEANVVIAREGDKIVFNSTDHSKRYLKYLTKKYLKKHQLRDWLRVVATDKETYVVKYFRVGEDEEEDQE